MTHTVKSAGGRKRFAMKNKEFEKVYPPLPRLCFTPSAAQKLSLYVKLCDFEVSGLGQIELLPDCFLVQDVFILRQKTYYSYTELIPDDLAEFLISMVAQNRDPASLKLWWHSHAGMEVFWSPTDDYTAKGFQNDYMLSLVTNKNGDYRCRLDLYHPLKLTIDNLPITLPSKSVCVKPEIEDAIMKEISDKVIVYSG